MNIESVAQSMLTSSLTTASEKIKHIASNQSLVAKAEEPKEQNQSLASKLSLAEKVKLEKTVQGLNEFLSPTFTSVKFQLHEELDKYYVELVDRETKEVIREIPPKKLLDMYASMVEMIGIAVDRKL